MCIVEILEKTCKQAKMQTLIDFSLPFSKFISKLTHFCIKFYEKIAIPDFEIVSTYVQPKERAYWKNPRKKNLHACLLDTYFRVGTTFFRETFWTRYFAYFTLFSIRFI